MSEPSIPPSNRRGFLGWMGRVGVATVGAFAGLAATTQKAAYACVERLLLPCQVTWRLPRQWQELHLPVGLHPARLDLLLGAVPLRLRRMYEG